jgi:LPXTG-motif cell wall-anchored protein
MLPQPLCKVPANIAEMKNLTKFRHYALGVICATIAITPLTGFGQTAADQPPTVSQPTPEVQYTERRERDRDEGSDWGWIGLLGLLGLAGLMGRKRNHDDHLHSRTEVRAAPARTDSRTDPRP